MITQSVQTATGLAALAEYKVLPESGFIRQKIILGDPKAKPPILPIIPVCPSSWWKGIKDGIYPAPVKISANVTAWKAEDIRKLIDVINSDQIIENWQESNIKEFVEALKQDEVIARLKPEDIKSLIETVNSLKVAA